MNRCICTLVFLCAMGCFQLFGIELGETLKTDKHLIPFQSGFIHYRVKDQKLQLIFLNKKKIVIAPLAKEGLVKVRFMSARTRADTPYTMPLALQNNYLEGVRTLRLPLNYRLAISLTLMDAPQSLDLPVVELRPDDLNLEL